ncbi:hypothetical protein MHU86_21280 [Fragilaria crotonensis]|nr:hypothetical protein MHU86_21280 [Fragilaria crotonensis]
MYSFAGCQGDPVTIRIQIPANSGIQISSVLTLTYSRGQTFLDAITSAGPQKLTEVTPDGPYDFTIQTILPASFYAGLNNVPFVGSGTVLLRFGNARVRNLRFTIGDSVDHMPGRSASHDARPGEHNGGRFSLRMALAPIESEDAPTADSNTGAIIGGIVGGIAGVAVIIVALVLTARRRRRRKKEDDYAEGVYKDEGNKDEAYTEDDNKDDGDNEVDDKDEAFTKVDVKDEYAMTGQKFMLEFQ